MAELIDPVEVPVDEELRRVAPVIEALARQVAVPLSVDTRRSLVARAALAAGAAIADLTPQVGDQPARHLAQAGGFAAALLLSGVLVQYAPWPTRLSFWVLAVLLTLLFAGVWFLPHHTGANRQSRWRPRLPMIPRNVRPAFMLASLAMMTAYTHGVLVLSLGGQVARDLVGTHNALVGAAVLSLFPIMFGATSIFGRSRPPRTAMIGGAIASATGMALLALAVARQDLIVFLLATSTAGAGYSLLFMSGLQVINAAAPPDRRGGVLSAMYLFSYLSMGATAVVLGAVATASSLAFAVDLGAGVITVLSLATLLLAAAGHGLARRSSPD